MHSVFVAGSRTISKLSPPIRRRIDNIVKQEFTVLVGDANGADKAVQRYLFEHGYKSVVVYCMEACRNNLGNWPVRTHTAESANRRDRFYYGVKDLEMAKDANWGFMIWDGVSKGTLTNIMNLLNSEKKVLLFSGPAREFFTLKSLSDLHSALDASGVRDAKLLLARLNQEPTGSGSLDLVYRP